MADMMERNALVNAQGNASQVEILVNQAIRASPPPRGVQPLGRLDITRGFVFHPFYFILLTLSLFSFPYSSMLSDVFFDNIFTDMAFHSNYRLLFCGVYFLHIHIKNRQDQAISCSSCSIQSTSKVHSLPWQKRVLKFLLYLAQG